MKSYAIRNARVVLPDRVVDGASVTVVGGKIAAVAGANGELISGGDLHGLASTRGENVPAPIDARGLFLAPGFVELHIHGCGGLGFESDEPGNTRRIGEFLLAKGITTFVPTLQCRLDAVERVCAEVLADPSLHDRVAGIYLEGPFVSRAKRGGILEETIREPSVEYLETLLAKSGGMLRLMTVAPELPGIAAIVERLAEAGVIPSWGHSECSLRDIPESNGARVNVTHLFNAMSPVSHREPGLAMLPFLDPAVFFEVNADRIHLNEEAIRMCYRHLNLERLILISDAVVAAGSEPGEYHYFGRKVVSGADGVRYLDGTLVGSHCLIPEVVRRFAESTGSPVHEAVRLATLNPCRLLGIDRRKGSIETGKDADLVLLDEHFEAKRVFVGEDGGAPEF